MARLIKYLLDDGSEILVEESIANVQGIAGPAGQLATDSSADDHGRDRVDTKFENAIGRVIPALRAVYGRLGEIEGPEEITVEVSIGFVAGVGVILASAETNGAIKASLKWKKPT